MAAKKPQDETIRLEIEGEEFAIDMATLTLGEVEEAEIYFDAPMGEVNFESGRGTLFLAYLARKRKRPATTLDDIRKIQVTKVEVAEEPKAKRPTKKPAGSGDQS